MAAATLKDQLNGLVNSMFAEVDFFPADSWEPAFLFFMRVPIIGSWVRDLFSWGCERFPRVGAVCTRSQRVWILVLVTRRSWIDGRRHFLPLRAFNYCPPFFWVPLNFRIRAELRGISIFN